MKKILKPTVLVIILLLGNSLFTNLSAQSSAVNNSDFKHLKHQWKGNLQYLNYQDDSLKVIISCTMQTKFKRGKLRFAITFDEMKNGKKIKSKSKVKISKDGKYFLMDGEKWKITSSQKNDKSIQIISAKRGEDNNRSSDLRLTMTIEKGKSIIWKKDVKYDGTDSFFNRNQFSFSL